MKRQGRRPVLDQADVDLVWHLWTKTTACQADIARRLRVSPAVIARVLDRTYVPFDAQEIDPMNLCVKTGAYALLVDYNQVGACDLYLVGDSIIARFGTSLPAKPLPNADQDDLASVSHKLTLGQRGFWRADLGLAVVPLDQVEGELVVGYGRNGGIQAQELAKRKAKPTMTCPTCDGAAALTVMAGHPYLEDSVPCTEPECLDGLVPATQARIDALEKCLPVIARLADLNPRTNTEQVRALILQAHQAQKARRND